MTVDRNRRSLFKGLPALGAGRPVSVPLRTAREWRGRTGAQQARPLLHLAQRGANRASMGRGATFIDPFDAGKRGNNVQANFLEKFPPGGRRCGPLVEYDWQESPDHRTCRVTGIATSPELLWYDGPVYFRRTFTEQRKAGTRWPDVAVVRGRLITMQPSG